MPALIVVARRRGEVTVRRTLLGTALAVIPIALAVGVGELDLRVTDTSPNPGEMSALPGFVPPPSWLFLGNATISVTKAYRL